MKKILIVTLVVLMGIVSMAAAHTDTFEWAGQGSDSMYCEKYDGDLRGEDGWMHWVLTSAQRVTTVTLYLDGTGSGFYEIEKIAGGTIHFFTPYFEVEGLEAWIEYSGKLGRNSQLVISDYCPGVEEELTVSKTAVTAFTRTHDWSIVKSVDIDTFYLTIDGMGDGTATWTVDVDYEGYVDSDWNVSGVITIDNTGLLDAVITAVDDVLAGTPIMVDCGVEFPYTLIAGAVLYCDYDEDGKVEGFNEVTVTTEKDEYFADAAIIWGDPTTEINKTATIVDVSDLFGEVILGTVTAPDGDTFTYTYDFVWADFFDGEMVDACGLNIFENTASVIGDGDTVLDFDTAQVDVYVQCEVLDVSKTVVTYYERLHDWDIEKSVSPAAIKLYTDGSGDRTATWTINVYYRDYIDSAHNVSGVITIENTGYSDAEIISVVDVLAGTTIAVDCGVTFPYTLAIGATLTCDYDEDGYVTGVNEVTVTTAEEIFNNTYTASESIVWGGPDVDTHASVDIMDNGSLLGTLTAPNGGTFTYTQSFAYADYDACGDFVYKNTAKVVDGDYVLDYDTAELTVKVQCYVYETAYALGADGICFTNNWGWSNPILPGEYTWNLWAGAGQCDTSKGTLVGSVHVVYDEVTYEVTVTFHVNAGYMLKEQHVYVGSEPKLDGTAPGQYENEGPFDGSQVHVNAHGVVGMPDPNF